MKRRILALTLLLALLTVATAEAASPLSVHQMLAKIEVYGGQRVLQRVRAQDGTTTITRSDNPRVGALVITSGDDGVRYDYLDAIHQVMYSVEARRDLKRTAGKLFALKNRRVEARNMGA